MSVVILVVILVGALVLIAAPLTFTRVRSRGHRRDEGGAPTAPTSTGAGRRPPSGRPPPSAPPRPEVRRPPSRPPGPPRPVTGAPPPPVAAPAPPAEAPGEAPPAEAEVEAPEVEAPEAEAPAPPLPVKPRFRDRLGKARAVFGSFLARTSIDDETWEDLEEALIRADVGVGLTTSLLDDLRSRVRAEGISSSPELVEALKEGLKKSLASADRGLHLEPGTVNVWLFVGVNGVGKTTTIGKVGYQQAALGHKVVMAAGD
ncbi:MAG TPA: signal recognition particle receptor subunit alpha, partial [Acidimicrobiales bacterium]|nr:signal recognition particle receptor subunit alpha [Acidimicrobiales bacterium]